MNLKTAKELIQGRIQTASWTHLNTSDITYTNRDFDPAGKSIWARSTVVERLSTQGTLGPIGKRKWLRELSHIFNIYVPEETGTLISDETVDDCRAIMEGVYISGIFTFQTIQRGGNVPTQGWLQTSLETLMQYYEVR